MGKRREREGVVFLNEQMKMAGEVLSEAERGRLFEALRAYAMEGRSPDLSRERRLYRSIYGMMQSAQDKWLQKYEDTCERNRKSIKKRWSGGEEDTRVYERIPEGTENTNQIKSSQIKSSQTESNSNDDLYAQGTGVPGVGWLE